jgi:hypothetical protein
MNQTKMESFVEAWVNVFIGFPINYVANLVVLPWFGYEVGPGKAFWIGVVFTVISVARSYLVRRFFNTKTFSHKVVAWYRHRRAMNDLAYSFITAIEKGEKEEKHV